MRNDTSFGTWLEVFIVGAAALVLGCRQETPPAPTTAAKVAEIAVVNPARGFVDSTYHTVAITDDATGFAAITSIVDGGKLTYGVEIWQLEPSR